MAGFLPKFDERDLKSPFTSPFARLFFRVLRIVASEVVYHSPGVGIPDPLLLAVELSFPACPPSLYGRLSCFHRFGVLVNDEILILFAWLMG